eukprot:TRINITY_DN42647_c0_g1_i2.p1 TRINITY_DN42647_c0_g1~~TRINITY_DN42647_c0_g1_i2.p1  ORF type:complete len:294 (-),score=36.06 TRINITY_DN42647_c0_g1_i2:135-926(-)
MCIRDRRRVHGCSAGYFDDGLNENCKSCHYSCSHKITDHGSCNAPDSRSNCLKCDLDKKRILFNSTCICADGYYDDGANELCSPCHYSCSTCSGGSSSECTACNTTTNRIYDKQLNSCLCQNSFDDGQSLCTCSPGYFQGYHFACHLCQEYIDHCSECLSSTVCVNCSNRWVVNNSNHQCIVLKILFIIIQLNYVRFVLNIILIAQIVQEMALVQIIKIVQVEHFYLIKEILALQFAKLQIKQRTQIIKHYNVRNVLKNANFV